jgi:hypothetical protein
MPVGGDVGICLLILSGEVFDSGKNLFASGPSWSSAGTFEMYLWPGRTLSVKRGRGSEPAVEVDMNDSMTTGDEVVRGILRLGVEWESHECRAGW